MEETRQYFYPNPGRKDVDGVEWWKTDGYSGWYRWVTKNGKQKLITRRTPNWNKVRVPCGMK